MKRKNFKHWGLFIALQFITLSLFAQGPNNTGTYYQNANGKKGKALKTAMFNIIKTHEELSYKGLWTAFRTTDMREDGKVWDMYSDKTNYVFGSSAQGANYSKEGDSYNREHSFPKSWFGGKVRPMYTDLVHLVPTDGYVNNRRGNLPFGETEGDTYKSHNSFCKVGTCTYPGYRGDVFEPNDMYKGDFARIYFYMATAYEDKIANWKGTDFPNIASHDSYKPYKDWQMKMLMEWSKKDPVSQKEINRNKGIQSLQENRNPFVDYPGLEEYIWGSMQNVAFSYDNYQGVTSIPFIEFEAEPIYPKGWYNLNGQKVGEECPTQKGIYIHNGKKMVVE